MTDDTTLDERIEAWRKRWNSKIGADLFNKRKDELKAMFRPRRWKLQTSEKLAGHLFRVKEHHELHKQCSKCRGSGRQDFLEGFPPMPPKPWAYTDVKYELGFYDERLDRYGRYQVNETGPPKFVMPGSILFATGKYIERNAWDNDYSLETRQIEVLTEMAIGYIQYEFLWPIKKSEIEKKLSVNS